MRIDSDRTLVPDIYGRGAENDGSDWSWLAEDAVITKHVDDGGLPHSQTEPSMVSATGSYSAWFEHGRLHRTNGPAIETPTYRGRYIYGQRFSLDGAPAEEFLAPNGDVLAQKWWNHGRLDRTDGPAIIAPPPVFGDHGANRRLYISSDRLSNQGVSAAVHSGDTQDEVWLYGQRHSEVGPAVSDIMSGLSEFWVRGVPMSCSPLPTPPPFTPKADISVLRSEFRWLAPSDRLAACLGLGRHTLATPDARKSAVADLVHVAGTDRRPRVAVAFDTERAHHDAKGIRELMRQYPVPWIYRDGVGVSLVADRTEYRSGPETIFVTDHAVAKPHAVARWIISCVPDLDDMVRIAAVIPSEVWFKELGVVTYSPVYANANELLALGLAAWTSGDTSPLDGYPPDTAHDALALAVGAWLAVV